MWLKRARKVLIVDDEPLIRRVLSRFLNKDGVEVIEAESVKTALSVFHLNKPIDALLCDLYLGADSGWNVAESIYALQPTITIVMLTGCYDAGVAPVGLPYTVLNKPFSPDALRSALQGLW